MAEKLRKAEWGEYRLKDLFYVLTPKKRFDANKVQVLERGLYPYVVRTALNNGIKGFIEEDLAYLNEGNTISFGQDTATMFYQGMPYFTGDKIKVLKSKYSEFNAKNAQFLLPIMSKSFSKFSWGSSSFSTEIIENQLIQLPTQNGKIDFSFMENFIAELKALRVAELKALRVAELHAYLQATGLSNYTLNDDEQAALNAIKTAKWQIFNVEDLFGKATRGKRLKSADRTAGNLPFVTAGEADTGISAFIGNDVERFKPNTITIDMFGSAKYRNYEYGADDHIAVVHTDKLPKHAVLFLTSAMHKVANAGQFSYARNFYAKDADALNIELPVKDDLPDFDLMANYLQAIEKLVIQEVVDWADKEIALTEKIIE